MIESDAARIERIKDLKLCGPWSSATTISDAATARPAPVGASFGFMVKWFRFLRFRRWFRGGFGGGRETVT